MTPAAVADSTTDEVLALAARVVRDVVWCTVATAGADGAPRARVMHPVWWWGGAAPTALVTARRTPIKVAHLAASPLVSCSYWSPTQDTATIDARARWLDEGELAAAWHRIAAVPPPVGFDPAIIWPAGPGEDGVAMLRLTAHRVVVRCAGGPLRTWRMAGPRS